MMGLLRIIHGPFSSTASKPLEFIIILVKPYLPHKRSGVLLAWCRAMAPVLVMAHHSMLSVCDEYSAHGRPRFGVSLGSFVDCLNTFCSARPSFDLLVRPILEEIIPRSQVNLNQVLKWMVWDDADDGGGGVSLKDLGAASYRHFTHSNAVILPFGWRLLWIAMVLWMGVGRNQILGPAIGYGNPSPFVSMRMQLLIGRIIRRSSKDDRDGRTSITDYLNETSFGTVLQLNLQLMCSFNIVPNLDVRTLQQTSTFEHCSKTMFAVMNMSLPSWGKAVGVRDMAVSNKSVKMSEFYEGFENSRRGLGFAEWCFIIWQVLYTHKNRLYRPLVFILCTNGYGERSSVYQENCSTSE
ncbi:hypothetical protein Tco_0929894 [Tanacetum coccineum]